MPSCGCCCLASLLRTHWHTSHYLSLPLLPHCRRPAACQNSRSRPVPVSNSSTSRRPAIASTTAMPRIRCASGTLWAALWAATEACDVLCFSILYNLRPMCCAPLTMRCIPPPYTYYTPLATVMRSPTCAPLPPFPTQLLANKVVLWSPAITATTALPSPTSPARLLLYTFCRVYLPWVAEYQHEAYAEFLQGRKVTDVLEYEKRAYSGGADAYAGEDEIKIIRLVTGLTVDVFLHTGDGLYAELPSPQPSLCSAPWPVPLHARARLVFLNKHWACFHARHSAFPRTPSKPPSVASPLWDTVMQVGALLPSLTLTLADASPSTDAHLTNAHPHRRSPMPTLTLTDAHPHRRSPSPTLHSLHPSRA